MRVEGQNYLNHYSKNCLIFSELLSLRKSSLLIFFANLFFLGTFLINPLVLKAQSDSTMLDKHFKFQDGIYFSFAELRQNQPSISWDQTKVKLYSNPQTYITRVDEIKIVAGDSLMDLSPDSLYGISLGGIPYVYIGRSEDNRFAMFFPR